MKEGFNSRQNKIYDDYKVFSSDRLLEMIKNSDKYLPEVIEIITFILTERDAIPRFFKQDEMARLAKEKEEKEKQGKKDLENKLALEKEERQVKVKSYLKRSEQYSDKELSGIITKYLYYEPGAVEAVLIISERRHIITSGEKEILLSQIEKGYREKRNLDRRITKERKKINKGKVIIGIIILVFGGLLTLSGINLSFFGTPVVHYGTIIAGIALIFDGLV